MEPALERILRAHLSPDETLWWSGRPSARRMTLAVAPLPVLGLILMGLSGYILSVGRMMPQRLFWVHMTAGTCFFLGLILLLAPFFALLGTSRMTYAITDRRLLVVTRWPWSGVKSWEAGRLPAFTRVDSGDGTGDIRFGGEIRTRPMALVGLSDAPTVQRLLENLRRRAVPPS